MTINFIFYLLLIIFCGSIIVTGLTYTFLRYPISLKTTTISQSGVKTGIFGQCNTDKDCDESLICDIFYDNNGVKEGICKKALGSTCSGIYECQESAKLCIKNPEATLKTCQISTTGGVGQYPGTNGCSSGLQKDPISGLCLIINGGQCALDNNCISGSCFNNLCTVKKGANEKCSRDANCIFGYGCNIDAQNNGIDNSTFSNGDQKICLNSTTLNSAIPQKVCVGDNECGSGEICSLPYGVCQENNIGARAKHSICDSKYVETCNASLGCATLTNTTEGRCEPLITSWPTNVDCFYDPSLITDGSSCPIPMRCASQFVPQTVPGCVFLPDYGCNNVDGCIYGTCDSTDENVGVCRSTGLSTFNNYRWNPVVNGLVPQWKSDINASNFFDGSNVFPILTNSTDIFTVVSKGSQYTFFQSRKPLTFSDDPEIYSQTGTQSYVKAQFNIINNTGLTTFEAHVLCVFPYYLTNPDPINIEVYLGVAVNMRTSSPDPVNEGLRFMAVSFRPNGNYNLIFEADSFLGINPLFPTWVSRVKAYQNYIEFINETPSVSGKAYFGNEALGSFIQGTGPDYPYIVIAPGTVSSIITTLDVINMQRYRSPTSPLADYIYYLDINFNLIYIADVNNISSEQTVASNVDTFSIDQKTGAVFYVFKPNSSSAEYQLASKLSTSEYYIPFPVGNDGSIGNITIVKHFITHNYYNGTSFTADFLLHSNTITV